MATIRRFKNLESCQIAGDLCCRIKEVGSHHAFSKDFDLKREILRSAGPVMYKIAEGFIRRSRLEFYQFSHHSKRFRIRSTITAIWSS